MTMQRRKLIDWRFLVALGMVMAITYIIYAGLHAQIVRVQERAREATIFQTLTDKITDLQATQQATTKLFETNQRRMLDYTSASAARQAQQLQYMRQHGLAIPQRFVNPVPVPKLLRTTTKRHTTSRVKRHRTPATHRSPGKSGQKHGKGHGRGHGKGHHRGHVHHSFAHSSLHGHGHWGHHGR